MIKRNKALYDKKEQDQIHIFIFHYSSLVQGGASSLLVILPSG